MRRTRQKVVRGAARFGDNAYAYRGPDRCPTDRHSGAPPNVDSAFLTLQETSSPTPRLASRSPTSRPVASRFASEIEMKGHQADEKITAATNPITGAR